jgi:hypothetical protein
VQKKVHHWVGQIPEACRSYFYLECITNVVEYQAYFITCVLHIAILNHLQNHKRERCLHYKDSDLDQFGDRFGIAIATGLMAWQVTYHSIAVAVK